MNDENDWDHHVAGETVEGLVDCVNREEVVQSVNEMKTGFYKLIGGVVVR